MGHSGDKNHGGIVSGEAKNSLYLITFLLFSTLPIFKLNFIV